MKKMYKVPKDAKSLSQGYIPLAMMEKLPKKAYDKRPKKKLKKLSKEDTPTYTAMLEKYIKQSLLKVK